MKKMAAMKLFFIFFMPPVLLGAGLIVAVYQSELSASRSILETEEQQEISIDARIVRNEIRRALSDLRYLASEKKLAETLEGSDLHLEEITEEFINFSKQQGRYDQFRLIDKLGMEVVRVNFRKGVPEVIDPGQLRFKGKQDYFIKTFQLSPGQIYLSSFDLNKEGGQVEKPLNPVIRIGTPIFDLGGQKKGILLLNLKVDLLFDQLYQVKKNKVEHHMIINTEGYWIDSSNPEDEWGFVLSARRDRRFENDYPEAWEQLQSTGSGHFYADGGLFTYTTINPAEEVLIFEGVKTEKSKPGLDLLARSSDSWKLISFVSMSELTQGPKKTLQTLLLFYLLYCAVIGTSAYSLSRAISNRKKVSMDLKERDDRIHQIVETATDGIITIDVNGRIESANPAALRIFGYELKEVLGEKVEMLMPESFRNQHQRDVYQRVHSERDISGNVMKGRELAGLRKNGSIFLLEISLSTGRQDEVKFMTGIVRDITKRRALEEEVRRKALYDSLTQLPNRALLLDRLSHCINQAGRREDYLFAILFLDLDRFKAVNDSLGHLIGDQLLIGISKRLTHCVRSSDTVARLGGDEMGILIEDICDVNDATLVAERVLGAFKKPFDIEGNELLSSVSIGIALSATQYETPEEILRDADIAMYRAKTGGRGRYEIFDASMRERIVVRQHLEKDLRKAVVSEEFVLHYQAIISLKTGQIVGFEALVRWTHPERGLIPPDQFIPLAEETGLIIDIGQIVLRKACRQAGLWQSRYLSDAGIGAPIGMSINVSGKQLLQPDFIGKMRTVLREAKCDPGTIKIEITETLLMENVDAIQDILLDLKAMNIKLHIDDFGVGYSSLSYLHQFPFDALKIDRSFTAGIGVDETQMKIVTTLLALSEQLGLDVIAEGIETAEQLEALKTLNCKYGQGYYFSKPVDAEAASLLLEKEHELDKQNEKKGTVVSQGAG